jgi:hypothetical protein
VNFPHCTGGVLQVLQQMKSPVPQPGQAEVILLVESQPENDATPARVHEWEALFKETQSLPQAQSITEEDIAAEIAAYRAEKKNGRI